MDIRNRIRNAVNNAINSLATNPAINRILFALETEGMALRQTTRRAWINLQAQLLIASIAIAAILYATTAFIRAHYVLIRLGWRPWRRYEVTELPGLIVLLDIHTGVWYCVSECEVVRIANGVATTRRWR